MYFHKQLNQPNETPTDCFHGQESYFLLCGMELWVQVYHAFGCTVVRGTIHEKFAMATSLKALSRPAVLHGHCMKDAGCLICLLYLSSLLFYFICTSERIKKKFTVILKSYYKHKYIIFVLNQ